MITAFARWWTIPTLPRHLLAQKRAKTRGSEKKVYRYRTLDIWWDQAACRNDSNPVKRGLFKAMPAADNQRAWSNSTVGRLVGYSMLSDSVDRVFIRCPFNVLAPHPKTRALIKRNTRSTIPPLLVERFLFASWRRALLFIILRYREGK